jgi:ribonuclease-3
VTDRIRWARRALGLEFSDPGLLEQALTHRSASRKNNERLEFLGDAMLGMSVASWLYEHRPQANEGDMSRARAALVNRRMLARVGRQVGVDQQLRLGAGELASGGAQRDSAIADAVEALIGAVLLDLGHGPADQLVRRLLEDPFAELPDVESLKDAKTRLQEWLQARSLGLPDYSVDDVSGSDHNQVFAVSCQVSALDKSASGSGSSRRRAEQAAAAAMLDELTSGDKK